MDKLVSGSYNAITRTISTIKRTSTPRAIRKPRHVEELSDKKVQVKMEMQIPHSSRVKFIAACSYSRLNDFMTSRKNDPKLPQTLISTSSSSVSQSDEVMN
ncbi:hypothetical protein Tco_0707672 [Tanacetum coccineum]|uniref:Uncharacterized protein n=1 Tax=Tanacetum coccineum TaxID=301880 RepID=A0ABQ4YB15_9ASTR